MARAAAVAAFTAAVVSLASLGWVVWSDGRDERPELRSSYGEIVAAQLVLVGIPAAVPAACAAVIRQPHRWFGRLVAGLAVVVGFLLTAATFGAGFPVTLVLWACAVWILVRRRSVAAGS